MKRSYWLLILWIGLIIAGSCARRGTPMGGPKDTIPPTLVRMYPELETVNFDDHEIELEFNEYIEARDLKKELIITPPVEDYDFYVSRRTLFLEIEDELRDSTTYTLNFREAIKDISERNPAQNIVVAFSTGPEIDSFQVAGTVRNLLTQQPVEEAVVSLYDVNDTLDIFTGPPMYLGKTDEEGNYTIRYIREGLYNIYAYVDGNSNLKVDVNNEPYGFKAESIYLGTDINKLIEGDSLGQIDTTNTLRKTIDLEIRHQDTRPITLQSARSNGKYYEVKFNKPLKSYTLRLDGEVNQATETYLEDSIKFNLADTSVVLFSNLQDQYKTIRVYNTLKQDSLQVQLSAIDSAQQTLGDTLLYVKFTESRRQAADFSTQFQSTENEITDKITGTVTFSKPIARISTDSILLSYDTLMYIPLNYQENLIWNEHYDQVEVSIPISQANIVDSVIYYSKYYDSLANEDRVRIQQLLLDSMQSSVTLEKRIEWLDQFAQQQRSTSTRRVVDSLQNLDSEDAQSSLLNSFIDTVQINSEWVPGAYDKESVASSLRSFNFYAAPGSFMSIESDSSEQIIQKFSFKQPEDYGTISGRIETEYSSYTVQLLNQNYEVVRESKQGAGFRFEMVTPGKYKIRILVDADNDGEWEDGNILKGEEPEPVYFYDGEELIDLRANWERKDLVIQIGELSTLSSE